MVVNNIFTTTFFLIGKKFIKKSKRETPLDKTNTGTPLTSQNKGEGGNLSKEVTTINRVTT